MSQRLYPGIAPGFLNSNAHTPQQTVARSATSTDHQRQPCSNGQPLPPKHMVGDTSAVADKTSAAAADDDDDAVSTAAPRNPLGDHPDVIAHTMTFVCRTCYLFFAGVSKQWKTAWTADKRPKMTSLRAAAQSPSRLAWARRCRCAWNLHTCAMTASVGSMESLKYVRGKGCGWNEKTCESAAGAGNLEVLKWCRARGCPWNSGTFHAAARAGRCKSEQDNH